MASFSAAGKKKPEQSGLCSGVVPLTGLEPARLLGAVDFKSTVSAIPPQRQKAPSYLTSKFPDSQAKTQSAFNIRSGQARERPHLILVEELVHQIGKKHLVILGDIQLTEQLLRIILHVAF